MGFNNKILWLSGYMIHHANRIRANADSIKAGGHQASCASSVGILTAYYFGASQPDILQRHEGKTLEFKRDLSSPDA